MTQHCQRDPKWKDEPLGFTGFSPQYVPYYTIGSAGCTITSIGNAVDMDPKEVNKKLQEAKAFSGPLVLWANIKKTLPLKFVWRGYKYDNTAVLSAIKRNGFCMVEARTWTGGKHWVLFIGNKKMIDPWYGTVRPTWSYPSYTGFCVLDKK